MNKTEKLLDKRRAGVLLHLTSLPGTSHCGDMGKQAYNFINFLKFAGVTVWQTLPLGQPHGDGSPYQCLSAHAGSVGLVDVEWLVEKGWLPPSELVYQAGDVIAAKRACLAKAARHFAEHGDTEAQQAFAGFCAAKAHWLDDYALFLALKEEHGQQAWIDWPTRYRDRDKRSVNAAQRRLAKQIYAYKFEQFVFFQQWSALKEFATRNGVLLFGDIPIFVSYDSSDVWAHRKCFKLDKHGAMLTVAGVPPDYFSETGQRWGNPHYQWDYMEATGFAWWLERIATQLELFDIIRIDHFRGLEAAWEIAASEPTAINGHWVLAPGDKLLQKISEHYPSVPLVAEDLGVITAEVDALREQYGLPGMKILQFAFDGNPKNPYLPFNITKNCVIYTGTHDNDTTLGWFHKLSPEQRHGVAEFLGFPGIPMPGAMVHAALASIANLAVIPMQDILELDTQHRMNIPGTIEGNWRWRFAWEQLTEERAARFAHWVRMFGRIPDY